MSGHSKWNNIKNRKGVQDQRKSRDFFLVAKMIRIAVKEHNDGNPDSNPALRLALEKARQVNMPKDNVQRAIDRALGKGDSGQQVQEIVYEGYGPGGAGVIVIAVTDNVQRTAGNIKSLFHRHGGALGGPGSAMFMFQRSGGSFAPTLTIPVGGDDMAALRELVGALENDDDVEEVVTNVNVPEAEA